MVPPPRLDRQDDRPGMESCNLGLRYVGKCFEKYSVLYSIPSKATDTEKWIFYHSHIQFGKEINFIIKEL